MVYIIVFTTFVDSSHGFSLCLHRTSSHGFRVPTFVPTSFCVVHENQSTAQLQFCGVAIVIATVAMQIRSYWRFQVGARIVKNAIAKCQLMSSVLRRWVLVFGPRQDMSHGVIVFTFFERPMHEFLCLSSQRLYMDFERELLVQPGYEIGSLIFDQVIISGRHRH